MNLLITNFYIFIIAVVLALLEIQTEGSHGWAEKLPAWRPDKNQWSYKFVWRIMTKELTGYHMVLVIFLLLFFHFPFFFGTVLSLENEVKILSLFFVFTALWDFLWFILNPHYSLKKFKEQHIWWHKRWLFGFPLDYYGSISISFLVLIPLFISQNDLSIFNWWLTNLGLFIGETIILILFSQYVLGIKNWIRH